MGPALLATVQFIFPFWVNLFGTSCRAVWYPAFFFFVFCFFMNNKINEVSS